MRSADLSKWKTGKVTTMEKMFWDAEEFNSNLSKWSTAKVKTLSACFDGAKSFDSDLSTWDLSGTQTSMNTFAEVGEGGSNDIAFQSPHGRKEGDAIKYTQKTGAITGLEDGKTYYVHTLNGVVKFSLAAVVGGPELVISGDATTIGNTFTWGGQNNMQDIFTDANLSPCNKRKIADAWKDNTAFDATTYEKDWAGDKCPVRSSLSLSAATHQQSGTRSNVNE